MLEVASKAVYRYQNGKISQQSQHDFVAQEVPVALVYNGISHAVMMATPKDLHHFAIGFSLAEQIIESVDEIYDLELETHPQGIMIQIELSSRRFMALKQRRRTLAGRTGCGICGTEQLTQIYQSLPELPFSQHFKIEHLNQLEQQFRQVQSIGTQTGCLHAALWLDLDGQLIAGFEDIGRHVALDKLLGYRAQQTQQQGVIVVSSRASYEMVQKVINCGVEILVAVSAPTHLAIQLAQQSGLTLIGFCRQQQGVIYTHLARITSN